jgi:FixJ family two-component response regulator
LDQVSKRRAVAVVDDDHSVRNATAKLLSLSGYEVHSFSSAEAFLQSDAVAQVDCLVSDVLMPGMSGLELHEHLRASGRHIPVIFVTAYPKDGDRARALAGGAVAFLTKPFDGQALAALIDELFDAQA